MVGTPAFMAPEQLGGCPGPFTDVWAMGITALFLATGRLPYAPECTISSMQAFALFFCALIVLSFPAVIILGICIHPTCALYLSHETYNWTKSLYL
jgi:serine/threonine protein kinase